MVSHTLVTGIFRRKEELNRDPQRRVGGCQGQEVQDCCHKSRNSSNWPKPEEARAESSQQDQLCRTCESIDPVVLNHTAWNPYCVVVSGND